MMIGCSMLSMNMDRQRWVVSVGRGPVLVAARVSGLYGLGTPGRDAHGPAVIGLVLGETPSPPAWWCRATVRQVLRALGSDGERCEGDLRSP